MEKDWKTIIGDHFKKNNLFRLRYLNEKLESHCNEYVSYLNEFNGVKASLRRDHYKWDIYGSLVTVSVRTDYKEYKDFKIFCVFNSDGHLSLKAAVDYDSRGFLFLESKKDDYCIYNEEEFTEPETVEKEYIFELFNARLIRYMEALDKQQ